jgi:hypothetical protein
MGIVESPIQFIHSFLLDDGNCTKLFPKQIQCRKSEICVEGKQGLGFKESLGFKDFMTISSSSSLLCLLFEFTFGCWI